MIDQGDWDNQELRTRRSLELLNSELNARYTAERQQRVLWTCLVVVPLGVLFVGFVVILVWAINTNSTLPEQVKEIKETKAVRHFEPEQDYEMTVTAQEVKPQGGGCVGYKDQNTRFNCRKEGESW